MDFLVVCGGVGALAEVIIDPISRTMTLCCRFALFIAAARLGFLFLVVARVLSLHHEGPRIISHFLILCPYVAVQSM